MREIPSIESILLESKKRKDKLRDEIAMRVISSLYMTHSHISKDLLCQEAYMVAEQMLKERDNYL